MELARSKGRAVRDRGSAIADVVGGVAQAPAQYYAGRDEQRARELRQSQIQQQIALEQSRGQREEAQAQRQLGLDTRAQTAQDAADMKEKALKDLIGTGFADDPAKFNMPKVVARAREIGAEDLIPTVAAVHEKMTPKVKDVDPTHDIISEGGALIRSGTPKQMTPAEQAQRDETARHNRETERISALTEGRTEAAQRETARHNLAMEAQGDAAPSLTPEALKLTAHQYAMTGQLPPMGMGKSGAAVRTNIINEAAKTYQNLDLPTQIAAYNANKESLKGLQKQRDSIGAFEQTAQKNIDVFLESAGKVVDTGSPLANALARQVTGSLVGSPDQAKYDAARQVAINEIAKITSNPTLSGQLSDTARKEVEAFNPAGATLKQTVAVMRLLKRDMDNRTSALDQQIGDVQKRIATPPGTPASKVETWVRDKDGKLVKQ